MLQVLLLLSFGCYAISRTQQNSPNLPGAQRDGGDIAKKTGRDGMVIRGPVWRKFLGGLPG